MYTRFCRSVACSPFPIEIQLLIRYVAHLTLSGRSFGTISNHLSSLKHVHQLLGFGKVWDTHYRFQLVLRGAKRYLGVSANRKHPFTPEILLQVFPLFQLDKPLHAAMWALFLVAFFTFLRKSNLVPDVASRISSKVPLRAHLVFDSHGATLHIAASKTIQYQQRSLSIPLPLIPGSPAMPSHCFKTSFASEPRAVHRTIVLGCLFPLSAVIPTYLSPFLLFYFQGH